MPTRTFYILTVMLCLSACNQKSPVNYNEKLAGGKSSEKLADKDTAKTQQVKRPFYRNVSEVIADSSYHAWVQLKDSNASLALHFMYKDTLAVSYSPECWLMFPYTLDGNKIVVYWENNIDCKYDFDIVKAINLNDKRYIGRPFMILELENDTTLKATYPIKELIRKINGSSQERTFFVKQYVYQDFYL